MDYDIQRSNLEEAFNEAKPVAIEIVTEERKNYDSPQTEMMFDMYLDIIMDAIQSLVEDTGVEYGLDHKDENELIKMLKIEVEKIEPGLKDSMKDMLIKEGE